ncbi:hypothetical protein [Propionispora sp. 2/2-37]|uniref:hypothetical protein n=1 Tax=Propionispora sp. 2/2-37 TaxID=1677858 RepID=UPI0012E16F4B|nr:hypothetical protein [Propionispora sp. 2/2-37]
MGLIGSLISYFFVGRKKKESLNQPGKSEIAAGKHPKAEHGAEISQVTISRI